MKSVLIHLIIALGILCVNGSIYETEDAIIVEVPPLAKSRTKRSIDRAQNLSPVTTWGSKMGEGGSCVTSKAQYGQCTSFKSCYPYFKKLPDLTIWDSWILGNYDTCTFFTEDGRQAFGVCCDNPPKAIEKNPPVGSSAANSNSIVDQKGSGFANWPPPIPTHPPNHAAPTHPPQVGYWPGQYTTTTRRPPFTLSTTTTKPGAYPWPPPLPTHPPAATTTTQASYNRPGEYCGTKNGNQDQERIVGGQNATPNEWPWIVVLFNGQRQFCGGSLIDDRHILTAAHCIAHMTAWDVARLTARLGEHNIKVNNEVQHVERKIKRVVRHRSFDPRTLYSDVAVLTMDTPITYSKNIRPICLPQPNSRQYSGTYGTVIGWGSLRENGPQPSVLQKVTVPIWSNDQCRSKYGSAAPGGIIESMVCAGQDSRDSCSGDSGGPLMVSEGSHWMQIGIVSWGIGCGHGHYPGVYTRVSSFYDWIMKNIQMG